MRRNSWAFGCIEGNARPTAARAQHGNDVLRHSDATKPTRSPQRHTRCKATKFLVSSRRWSHSRPPNVWQSLQSCTNTDNPSYIGLSCPHDASIRASALSNPIGHKVVTAEFCPEPVTSSSSALCFLHPRRQNIPTSFTHTSALMLQACALLENRCSDVCMLRTCLCPAQTEHEDGLSWRFCNWSMADQWCSLSSPSTCRCDCGHSDTQRFYPLVWLDLLYW